MAENIIIEFTADVQGLEPAVDQLERLGTIDKQAAAAFKATNSELQKRQQTLNTTAKVAQQAATTTKKSIDDVDKAVKTLTQDFIEGFQEGVTETLKEAGVTAEEFAAALNKGNTETTKSTTSLRSQLKGMVEELARMKAAGLDNTKEYKNLAKAAGELDDTLKDARQEVNNFGSDTKSIDGLISAAQGVAGGFAVAQGTAALFGDESEKLQETLLRVNAAMAILQGLQQVGTVLQKESAAVQLVTNAQLAIENGLNSTSIVVRTGAAVAQKVLNAAMAANPIGILVVAVAGLIAVLATFGRSAAEARRQTSALNVALSAGAENFKEREDAIRRTGEGVVTALENEGAVGSKIAKQEIENQKLIVEARKERQKELENLLKNSPDADLEKRQELSKEIRRLQDEEINDRIEGNNLVARLNIEQRREELQSISDIAAARLASTVKNSKAELDAAKAFARAKAAVDINAAGQNGAEILRIQSELNDQLRDLDRQFAVVRQQDRIAAIEAALIAEQQISQAINARQSQAEIDLQKRLIQQQANLELLQEGLTQNQILQIKKQAQSEILRLQKDFNKQASEEALQDFISANNAQLAAIDLTNKERLDLTIDNIIAQAEIEVQQNEGLSQKIKEINAKRDADIKAARLASIQQTLEQELELTQLDQASFVREQTKELEAQSQIRAAISEREKRAIEDRLNVRRLTLVQEFQLIDDLSQHELDAIEKRVEALNKSFTDGLISYAEYNREYKRLTDEQAKIVEDGEQKKRDAAAQTEAAQKAATQRAIQQTVDYAQTSADILAGFAENEQQRELNKLDADRQRIEELRKEGKISEQEATARLKRLDVAERRIRREQAQREKQLAIFNAIIATAVAVARAGNPILAAIAAALGAAQIAVIASKPIPQFGKGKKNNYEGLAEIGETGAELVERNGQLYVAPKKTIVWLGEKDKVFNPQETIAMLEKPGLRTQKIDRVVSEKVTQQSIDYDKLGKAIAKGSANISLNIDGYKDFVINGHNFTTYLNSRRGYK